MGSEFETIRVDRRDGVTTITFNRPEKRNAMSPQLHRDMYEALTELEGDDETRVLVLTGAGESFCAGQDLKEYFLEMEAKPRERARIRQVSNDWRDRKLRLFPKPTIAMINGWCFGGAFTVVASCDIAVAAEEAVFGLSEINFGNIPGGLVTKVVHDTLRPRDALYYILTGERFDGRQAAAMGWVTRSVPRERLQEEVDRIAAVLKEKDPIALRVAKEAFKVGVDMNYEESWWWLSAKVNELTYLQKGAWMSQGIGQFLEGKYKPGLGSFSREEPSERKEA